MLFMKSHGGLRLALSAALVAGSAVAATLPQGFAARASSSAASAQIGESSPLSLSSTTVSSGGQVTATVTLQNQGSVSVAVTGIVFATRTPSGSNADFGGRWTTTTLAPSQTISLQASRTFSSADPLGVWTTHASYRTSDNVWHDLAPTLSLTVGGLSPAAAPTQPAPTATQAAPTATQPAPTATTVATAQVVESSPLSLGTTAVAIGGNVNATVTLKNQGNASIVLTGIVFATRTPSGGNADFGGNWATTTLAPNQTVSLQASRTFSSSDPVGAWTVVTSYRTTDNVWHDVAPAQSLTVSAPAVTAIATQPTATATNAAPRATATTPAPAATATQPAATKQAPTTVQPSPTTAAIPSSSNTIALGATIHDNGLWVGPGTGLLEWYANMVGDMPAIANAAAVPP